MPVTIVPQNVQAIITGSGDNFGEIKYIKGGLSDSFTEESIVYTSGTGAIFKSGIPIGKLKVINNKAEIMLISEKINKIKDDFSFFDNWEDKYQYLIDLGKKLPVLDDSYKTEEYRVQGCTSNLWMVPEFIDGKINFSGSSDSVIVKGLFYLVYYAYNEETPETIINNPLSFFEEIGLSNHLGQSRSNGLNSLRKKITSIATELSNK